MGLGTLEVNLDKAASSLPDLGSLVKMFTGGDKKNETGGGQTQQQGGSASDNTGSATPVKTGDLILTAEHLMYQERQVSLSNRI